MVSVHAACLRLLAVGAVLHAKGSWTLSVRPDYGVVRAGCLVWHSCRLHLPTFILQSTDWRERGRHHSRGGAIRRHEAERPRPGAGHVSGTSSCCSVRLAAVAARACVCGGHKLCTWRVLPSECAPGSGRSRPLLPPHTPRHGGDDLQQPHAASHTHNAHTWFKTQSRPSDSAWKSFWKPSMCAWASATTTRDLAAQLPGQRRRRDAI